MAAENKTGCFLNFPKKSLSGPARPPPPPPPPWGRRAAPPPPPTGGLFAVRTTHTVKLKNE